MVEERGDVVLLAFVATLVATVFGAITWLAASGRRLLVAGCSLLAGLGLIAGAASKLLEVP